MSTAIVDRFEGDNAVLELESGQMLTVSRTKLSVDAREGDVMIPFDDGFWRVDPEATARRRKELAELIQEITTQTCNNK